VRPRLFNSDDFWSYWQGMALPTSYEQSIIRHETRFTPYFAARGYAWDTYVQTDDLKPVFVNPIMACPRELLANRGGPGFPKAGRSFFIACGTMFALGCKTLNKQYYGNCKTTE